MGDLREKLKKQGGGQGGGVPSEGGDLRVKLRKQRGGQGGGVPSEGGVAPGGPGQDLIQPVFHGAFNGTINLTINK